MKVNIYYCAGLDEYDVYDNGEAYFTNDFEDAIATCKKIEGDDVVITIVDGDECYSLEKWKKNEGILWNI